MKESKRCISTNSPEAVPKRLFGESSGGQGGEGVANRKGNKELADRRDDKKDNKNAEAEPRPYR